MYVDTNEFNVAFVQVQSEYPKISRHLAESFISKLGDAVKSNRRREVPEKFGDLLRRALNDSHVWTRVDREPYKVLAGKFFGRRGGHAAHRTPPAKNRQKSTRVSPVLVPVPVKENAKGQLTWML